MNGYLITSAAGFGAGFVNAVAGGGSLLSFPALLYTGMPAITANATSTLALWPGSVTSSWAYRKYLAKQQRNVLTLALPSILGGLAGAILLLCTPEKAFRLIVPYLILLACGLLMANEPIGRLVARHTEAHPRKASAALWLIQFLIAVYGGYFGAGIGIMMLAAMAIFLPEDMQSANALKNFFAVLINGTAAVYFLVVGAIVLPVAVLMACAAIVGGFTGAHAAQRMSPRLLRGAVVVYGIFVAVDLMVKK